jgi:hypothetical protein
MFITRPVQKYGGLGSTLCCPQLDRVGSTPQKRTKNNEIRRVESIQMRFFIHLSLGKQKKEKLAREPFFNDLLRQPPFCG